MAFVFHQYVFLDSGREIHVFYAIYEDQTGSTVLANRRRDTRSRLAAVLTGSRNQGQRFFELVVRGPGSAELAKVELAKELSKIIVNN